MSITSTCHHTWLDTSLIVNWHARVPSKHHCWLPCLHPQIKYSLEDQGKSMLPVWKELLAAGRCGDGLACQSLFQSSPWFRYMCAPRSALVGDLLLSPAVLCCCAGSEFGLRFLVYSGDTDGIVPVSGTRRWVHQLGMRERISWRPWFGPPEDEEDQQYHQV
jgi:hypothetical protein